MRYRRLGESDFSLLLHEDRPDEEADRVDPAFTLGPQRRAHAFHLVGRLPTLEEILRLPCPANLDPQTTAFVPEALLAPHGVPWPFCLTFFSLQTRRGDFRSTSRSRIPPTTKWESMPEWGKKYGCKIEGPVLHPGDVVYAHGECTLNRAWSNSDKKDPAFHRTAQVRRVPLEVFFRLSRMTRTSGAPTLYTGSAAHSLTPPVPIAPARPVGIQGAPWLKTLLGTVEPSKKPASKTTDADPASEDWGAVYDKGEE